MKGFMVILEMLLQSVWWCRWRLCDSRCSLPSVLCHNAKFI